MTTSSEDILLLVNGVRHKKNDGTLYLMAERIAWMPNGKDCFTISYKYSDIKIQKISPEGKPKIQLQIVLHNNEATTFHFVNPEGIEKQLKDRKEVKELLQQLLPRFKKKISKELEEKNQILSDDPELFQLYKDLVVSQVITAEEFWTKLAPVRCPSLIKTLNIPTSSLDTFNLKNLSSNITQRIGISPAFLADIKSQADGCNGIKYNITTDIIEAIFRTYPAVKRKHFENVPHKISDSEFWTRFFQSHYFHRDRVFSSCNSSKSDLFADCAKIDENEVKKAAKKGVVDPFVDLTCFDDVHYLHGSSEVKEDKETKSKDRDTFTSESLPNANRALIERFNLHSFMILEASKSRETSNESQEKSSLVSSALPTSHHSVNGVIKNKSKDKKVSESVKTLAPQVSRELSPELESEEVKKVKTLRLKEKTEIEDLDSNICSDSTSWINKEAKALTISNKQRYLAGPTPVTIDSVSRNIFTNNHNFIPLLDSLCHQENVITHWKLSLNTCLSSPAAITALSELSPGGALLKSSHTICLKDVVPHDVQKELKQLYFSCNELLRHFWNCFPVTSDVLEEKVIQMKATLERFQFTKIQPFHDRLIKDHYDSEVSRHT